MKIALVGAELEENLALRYIWGALEADGHEVSLIRFDLLDDIDQAARELADSGARLAGFSMVFTHRAGEFAALATRAREAGFDGHMVAGGHFATFNAGELLNAVPEFDSIGCGEGEDIMCDLARHLDDPGCVKGLVWRAPDRLVTNPPAAKPRDLDKLPHPVRKMPFDDFFGLPIVNMLGSRGCTHHCAFCSIAAWHRHCGGAVLRQRAPELVADEMADLYHSGVRLFNFHDDNFLVPNRKQNFARAEAIEKGLRERGVGRIGFAIKARPDNIDRKLFEYLKEIGLFRVFLGIEAGTELTLRALGRSQTLEQNQDALKTLNEIDIHACFNMLLFGPDTTIEDLRGNVEFLHEHPHNPMNFCRTELYAGTPLETKMRREGRLLGDFWGYDYRIADDRVQHAFELVEECLTGRHRGLSCVNHLAMEADYDNQVLGHFFGVRPRLRNSVKAFIARLNRNTARYLLDVVDTVGAAEAGFDYGNYAARLRARMEKDNAKFAVEARRLINGIENAARNPRPRHASSVRRTVAATVMLGLAVGCTQRHTEMSEMVAAPTPALVQPPSALSNELKTIIMPNLLEKIDVPRDTNVIVIIKNKEGKARITGCTIIDANGMAVPLDLKGVQYQVQNIDPKTLAANYRIMFSKSDIEAGMRSDRYIQLHRRELEGEPVPYQVPKNSPLAFELEPIILPILASQLPTPRDAEIRFQFESRDHANAFIKACWIDDGDKWKPLNLNNTKYPIKNVDPNNLAGSCVIQVTKDEIEKAKRPPVKRTFMIEMTAHPSITDVPGTSPLSVEIKSILLPYIVNQIHDNRDLSLTITIVSTDGKSSRMTDCWVNGPKGPEEQINLFGAQPPVKNIDSKKRSDFLTLRISKAEMEKARPQRNTMMWEIVAAPPKKKNLG